jgi:hypothetical protein
MPLQCGLQLLLDSLSVLSASFLLPKPSAALTLFASIDTVGSTCAALGLWAQPAHNAPSAWLAHTLLHCLPSLTLLAALVFPILITGCKSSSSTLEEKHAETPCPRMQG